MSCCVRDLGTYQHEEGPPQALRQFFRVLLLARFSEAVAGERAIRFKVMALWREQALEEGVRASLA